MRYPVEVVIKPVAPFESACAYHAYTSTARMRKNGHSHTVSNTRHYLRKPLAKQVRTRFMQKDAVLNLLIEIDGRHIEEAIGCFHSAYFDREKTQLIKIPS